METIDKSTLESLLGNSTQNLIPESLVTTITIGFIVLNVIGVLFIVLYLIGTVRKWKAESAVFHMQRDVAEIKNLLANQSPVQKSASSSPLGETSLSESR